MTKYLLLLTLLLSANSFSAVNKWVDKNNQVHYSDQAPPIDAKVSTPAKSKVPAAPSESEDTTENNVAASASAPPAPKTIAEREADLKKAQKAKQEAAEKAAQKQAQEASVKANCTAAQQNLRNLQSGERIAETDASGERIYLDDNQRQQRIIKAQQGISTFCK